MYQFPSRFADIRAIHQFFSTLYITNKLHVCVCGIIEANCINSLCQSDHKSKSNTVSVEVEVMCRRSESIV